MTTFVVHTIDSAPDGSRQPAANIVERVGFLPNLAATLADSPTAIESFSQLQATLRGTTLTALEREVVGITVSFVNTSGYSLAAHSTFARRLGASDELVEALRSGTDVPDPSRRGRRGLSARPRRAHPRALGLTARTIAACMPCAASCVNVTLGSAKPAVVKPARYSDRDSAPAMHPT